MTNQNIGEVIEEFDKTYFVMLGAHTAGAKQFLLTKLLEAEQRGREEEKVASDILQAQAYKRGSEDERERIKKAFLLTADDVLLSPHIAFRERPIVPPNSFWEFLINHIHSNPS